MNETSSRSHAALMITITMRDDDLDGKNDHNNNTDIAASVTAGGDNNDGKPVSYRESSLVIVDLAVS